MSQKLIYNLSDNDNNLYTLYSIDKYKDIDDIHIIEIKNYLYTNYYEEKDIKLNIIYDIIKPILNLDIKDFHEIIPKIEDNYTIFINNLIELIFNFIIDTIYYKLIENLNFDLNMKINKIKYDLNNIIIKNNCKFEIIFNKYNIIIEYKDDDYYTYSGVKLEEEIKNNIFKYLINDILDYFSNLKINKNDLKLYLLSIKDDKYINIIKLLNIFIDINIGQTKSFINNIRKIMNIYLYTIQNYEI